MSASSLKTVRDAIKRRSFDGAYFITGEDDYQKDDAVKQLVEAALEPALRDFNLDTRRAADLDVETLGVLLSTPPMMSDRRVIVLREVNALKKDARKALDQYLKSPATDLLLIMTAAVGVKADAGIAASATALEFNLLTGDRVPKWISHHATTELGIRITEPAIELLQAAVGSDLHQLAGELDKLASYVQGRGEEIGEDAVAAIVGVRSTGCGGRPERSALARAGTPCFGPAENNGGVSRHGIVHADAGNFVGARPTGRRSFESPPCTGVLRSFEGDRSLYRPVMGIRYRRLGTCSGALEPRSTGPRARFPARSGCRAQGEQSLVGRTIAGHGST